MHEPEVKPNLPKKCPQCGAVLPEGALSGLCPACLLQQGAAADTATQADAPRFQPPGVDEVARLFPQLEILSFIGKGGMGAVYKARQRALDRFVALKILPSQSAGGSSFADRFNREARALAKLNHPNIVAIHEFGVAAGVPPAVEPGVPPGGKSAVGSTSEPLPAVYPGGKMPPSTAGGMPAATALPFFIMEYVDGLNLRQLEQAGKLSPREALQIVPQICEALQFAHDEGIVHRDIKPENILLDKRGRVKIADFGIARIMAGNEPGKPLSASEGDRKTATPGEGQNLTEQQVIGTPHYMAPEQVEQPQTVDHRADIYSLGVVFYEMLTGELPLGKFAPPSRKVQVDVRLDEIVLRALEKEPELRYQRVSQVRTDVETIVATGTRHAAPPAHTERIEPSPVSDNFPTWSPFQSAEVREICAHLTQAEKSRTLSLGILYGLWVAATTFGPWALLFLGNRRYWFPACALVLLHIALIPTWLRKQREFLCSTAWARARGFKPEQLRLFSFGGGGVWMGMAVFGAVMLLLLPVLLSFLLARHRLVPPPQQPARMVAPQEPPPAVNPAASIPRSSAAELAEPPKLRFLAWQDEWQRRQPRGARHPDGSEVTDESEERLLSALGPGGCDVSGTEAAKRHPRFLHLWFSHPLFDRQSLTEVKFLDGAGQPIPLGGDGIQANGAHTAEARNDNLSWLTCTLSPGDKENIPRSVTVRLRYTVGPLEKQQQLATDNNSVVALEGGSQLNGVGTDRDGNAFLAIAVDERRIADRRFGVTAVARDGRRLELLGGATGGNVGASLSIARFEFAVPLADIAHFLIGTRPVRTMEWKDVVLPAEQR